MSDFKWTAVQVCVHVCSCVLKGQDRLLGRWALQQLSARALWAPSPPQSIMGKQFQPPPNPSGAPSLSFPLSRHLPSSLHPNLSIPPSLSNNLHSSCLNWEHLFRESFHSVFHLRCLLENLTTGGLYSKPALKKARTCVCVCARASLSISSSKMREREKGRNPYD